MSNEASMLLYPFEQTLYQAQQFLDSRKKRSDPNNVAIAKSLIKDTKIPCDSSGLFTFLNFQSFAMSFNALLKPEEFAPFMNFFDFFHGYGQKYKSYQMSDCELHQRIEHLLNCDVIFSYSRGDAYEKAVKENSALLAKGDISLKRFNELIAELGEKYPQKEKYSSTFWEMMTMIFKTYLHNRSSISREIADKYDKFIRRIFKKYTLGKEQRDKSIEDSLANISSRKDMPEFPEVVRSEYDRVIIYIDPAIKGISTLLEEEVPKNERDMIIFGELFKDCYDFVVPEWQESYNKLFEGRWEELKGKYPKLARKFVARGQKYYDYVFEKSQEITDSITTRITSEFEPVMDKIVSFYNPFSAEIVEVS